MNKWDRHAYNRKLWMTEEIIKIIKERNLQKKKDYRVQKIIQSKITKNCKDTKYIGRIEISVECKRTQLMPILIKYSLLFKNYNIYLKQVAIFKRLAKLKVSLQHVKSTDKHNGTETGCAYDRVRI